MKAKVVNGSIAPFRRDRDPRSDRGVDTTHEEETWSDTVRT